MSSDPFTEKVELLLRLLEKVRLAAADLDPQPKAPPGKPSLVSPAWSLRITHQIRGGAWVVVNEFHKFPLSPKLARLLEVLAADDGRCTDGSVAWKPVKEVRSAMKDHPAALPPTARAVSQLASRLRKCLDRVGVDPRLVQYSRRRQALRFAFRPPPKIADTSCMGAPGTGPSGGQRTP